MNLPNKLTLIRICMVPVFVVFAVIPGMVWQLLAALIFVAACLTDTFDGKIARSQNLVTNFGKFADPIADKLLVMSAMVVLVSQSRMPAWVCILMLAREFIISGLRLVIVSADGQVVAAGMLGKIKTVIQMVSLVMLLVLVPLEGDGILGFFGVVMAYIAMYLALIMTVISGVGYLIDNFKYIKDA